jgi:hypothetical protein
VAAAACYLQKRVAAEPVGQAKLTGFKVFSFDEGFESLITFIFHQSRFEIPLSLSINTFKYCKTI